MSAEMLRGRTHRWLVTVVTLLIAAAGVGVGIAAASARVTPGTTMSVAPPATTTASSASPATAVAAVNGLATKLLPRLGGAGNAVFSPYSIATALAMVDQGAAGATEQAIDHVLGVSSPQLLAGSSDALNTALAKAVGTGKGAGTLSTANSLWVQSRLPLRHPFQTALADDFGSSPTSLNFAANPSAATSTINHWTAQRTHNLIPELFPQGSLDATTQLVLVSAIYLHAFWALPFTASRTAPAPFYPSAGHSVSVPFMTTADPDTFEVASTGSYQAVALPYRNTSLSMLAVMPSQGTLQSFESRLTPASLGRIAGSLRDEQLVLQMPKLTLNLHQSLNGVLSQLGMATAFGPAANFSGITKATALQIGIVEHAAVMKINESGTTAAAATGVSVTSSAAFGPTRTLTLNHPYLLFLRDDRTGAILFAARVANPAAG